MSLRQVTVGVVGGGKASDNLVCDALNEHFAFGPEDADGYYTKSTEFDVHLIFPVGAQRFTQGIHAVWQWAVRTEIRFSVISDNTDFAAEQSIQDSLADTGDWLVSPSPEASLISSLAASPAPMLLVLPLDGEYTDYLQTIAASALAAGIPVYDLSRALLEQTWEDIGVDPAAHVLRYDHDNDAAEQEPDAQQPVAAESVLLSAEDADALAVTVTGVLAQAYALVCEFQRFTQGMDALAPQLAATERLLRDLRDMRPPAASGTGMAVISFAPAPDAQQLVTADAADLAEPGVEVSGVPAVPDDPAPGDPNPAELDSRHTRTEVWDEESGQWRAAGRGRPKAGARTRRVPK